ncbi:phosphotransferase system enzyme I (PtsI) [Paenibacillus phyllosphaerae]|uniref:Phosphoenolpyruvate-protein phosphotransferase n=1 Tax=Paenibacillus phyllosphaerae TaxID=274593 RepID=A0A7W5ATV9_9BACL|nr:phosphoenolpyruvate--protein phosphotransferase [Paenibacillus phyllosphaerae]MBB3108181.1 phosphotransferase system enzyme I (PtsI) [Paenibacillus phyllosphaerae]
MTVETLFHGIGVSEGARIGRAFVYRPIRIEDALSLKTDQPEAELEALRLAKQRCIEELEQLIEHTAQTLGEEKAVILKGQVSMLNDPSFYPPMENAIRLEQWAAETAVSQIVTKTAALFESMTSAYMQERASDVRDVGARLLMHVKGSGGGRLGDIQEEVILVADDLTPSDTVQLDKQLVRAFVTRIGGKTSHTAILANSLRIPAILGAGDAVDDIQTGDLLAIDGATGEIIVHPSEGTIAGYEAVMATQQEEQQGLAQYATREAVTTDGHRVEIAANIGTPEEAQGLVAQGAEAVGLYRTEFLFMSRSQMPDEETQYRAYREAVEAMEGRPVVIRTLDIGGDKELPYLDLPKEMNPFLGYRAIRLCLDERELLMTQLRAILRASAHGPVKIMFPMISGMQEWREAREMVMAVRYQLEQDGVEVGERIELGIMVEIPSAALQADRFAREVDFFSIGTNDLVQYTLAVDRMNEKVADLYDYFHPAVLRLIKRVIDASNVEGKWTGMCGSMAGDPLAAPLLIGLGLHEWSMSPAAMHKVKQVITSSSREACRALAERVLDMDSAAEVREALQAFAGTHSKN